MTVFGIVMNISIQATVAMPIKILWFNQAIGKRSEYR